VSFSAKWNGVEDLSISHNRAHNLNSDRDYMKDRMCNKHHSSKNCLYWTGALI